MFNEDYVTFPRDDIAKLSGPTMPVNKRNWRKQDQHLELIRGIRDLKGKMGEAVSGGGRPEKRGQIFEYMRSHPEVKKKTEIARALQIDRGTVAKYYDEILQELQVTM